MSGAMAANAQRQIDFTRAHEQEADRIGYRLLSQAGFEPEGMSHFFERLDRLSGSAAEIPEFLRTHPLPTNRAADTFNRQTYVPQGKQWPRDKTAYYLAKARVQVLTAKNTAGLIQRFQTALAGRDYENENATRYGYMLALKRAGRYADAEREIARLRQADPNRLAYRIEEAELALARGDARAWRLYDEAKALFGDDYTLAMQYGRALATQGDPRKALDVLQPHLGRHSGDAELYNLYAQAAQRSGDNVKAHTALAEYYYLNQQFDAAVDQAEYALRDPSITPYQQAQTRARLREIKQAKRTAEQR